MTNMIDQATRLVEFFYNIINVFPDSQILIDVRTQTLAWVFIRQLFSHDLYFLRQSTPKVHGFTFIYINSELILGTPNVNIFDVFVAKFNFRVYWLDESGMYHPQTLTHACCHTLGRSFVLERRNGPGTDPCGTPYLKDCCFVWTPFALINGLLSHKRLVSFYSNLSLKALFSIFVSILL